MIDEPDPNGKIKALPEENERTASAFKSARLTLLSREAVWGAMILDHRMVTRDWTGITPPITTNYKQMAINAVPASQQPTQRAYPCFAEQSVQAQMGLLLHQIWHLVRGDLLIPSTFNRIVVGIAQDVVVNRLLRKYHFAYWDAMYPKYPVSQGDWVIFEDWQIPIDGAETKEWVTLYWDLLKYFEDNNIDLTEINYVGDLDYDASADSDLERERELFMLTVRSLVESLPSRGSLPAEALTLLEEYFKPVIDWTGILHQLVRTAVSNEDFSWSPNPRKAHLGFFPILKSQRLSDVFLVLDTSGSMAIEELQRGVSEFKGLWETTPFNLHYIPCDADVHQIESFESPQEPDWLKLPVIGGGGTNFIPVFERVEKWIEETGRVPDLLVYCTDMDGFFPEEGPDYPVVWVSTFGVTAPFGTVIRVDA